VGEEVSKYKLDLLGVQEVRWGGGEYRRSDGAEVALNQQANIHFSTERGMGIMN
jgi:hypothetical protein